MEIVTLLYGLMKLILYRNKAMERTLSIIKPDAVQRNIIGNIIKELESAGLQIVEQKMIQLSESLAKEFYAEHAERPFFDGLVSYMTSGRIVVMVLEGENAVELNRKIMGATNPKDAEKGTIREKYAIDIERNSVHGSDSLRSAMREIALFF